MASAAASSRRFRRRLVAELEARRCIVSPSVRDAFLSVPREAFLPSFAETEGVEAVYADIAVSTKHGSDGRPTSSSSQPAIMALMLERLDVRRGQRVLEVGAGTGYNAALLRELVGPRGEVVSVELDDDVARGARRGLRTAGRGARVVVGDGHDGWPARAPYDRIIVTASSASVPSAWRDQLVEGGLLEVPLRLRESGPHAIVTFRRAGDRLSSVAVLCGGFMPLRGAAAASATRASHNAATSVHGRWRPLADLSGAGVALGSAARKRLLALFLAGPHTSRRLRLRTDGWSLALYLGLALPRRRVVESSAPPEFGIGVAGRDGRSLALVTIEPPARRRRAAAGRVLSYGEPEAVRELESALARWEQDGWPTEDDLRADVVFGSSGGRVRAKWAKSRRRSLNSAQAENATR